MIKLDESKTYYLMTLKGGWYAVALESYQITFLQQYINARAFNMPLKASKISEAKKKIEIYDFTSLDDDKLIHIFFKRQKEYKEKTFEYTPNHLEQKNADERTLQKNKEFKKMSPYNFSKKKNEKTYYIMKIAKKWHAVALECYQVQFLSKYINAKIFSKPVDYEKLQTAQTEIFEYDFTKLDNEKLYKYFTKKNLKNA
jgi:hypothetical protein